MIRRLGNRKSSFNPFSALDRKYSCRSLRSLTAAKSSMIDSRVPKLPLTLLIFTGTTKMDPQKGCLREMAAEEPLP